MEQDDYKMLYSDDGVRIQNTQNEGASVAVDLKKSWKVAFVVLSILFVITFGLLIGAFVMIDHFRTATKNDMQSLNISSIHGKISKMESSWNEGLKQSLIDQMEEKFADMNSTLKAQNQDLKQSLLRVNDHIKYLNTSLTASNVTVQSDFIKTLKDLLKSNDPAKEIFCGMGMESGEISDQAITASSVWDSNHAAYRGRLDFQRVSDLTGAWSARQNRVGEWIQVYFGKPKLIEGMITQGRSDVPQWVTSYKVSCGNTDGNMTIIKDDGADKIFKGNSDMQTKVVNVFPNLMTCRYIRIYPQTWNGHISMRLEFIRGACHDLY